MGQSQQAPDQAVLLRETQDLLRVSETWAHSSLRADYNSHSVGWGGLSLKVKFPGNKTLTPSSPWPQPKSRPCQSASGQGHRTRFLCPFVRASKKVLDWIGSQQIIYDILIVYISVNIYCVCVLLRLGLRTLRVILNCVLNSYI